MQDDKQSLTRTPSQMSPCPMNPSGHFSFQTGLVRLKKLCSASSRPASRVRCMRFYLFVFLAALALLASDFSPSASAATAPRRRAAHAHAAAAAHRTASHRTDSRRPASRAVQTHTYSPHARRRHGAALIAAHRHPVAVSPQKVTVAATVPAIPMKRWALLPPLVGSHESLVRQNQRTEADGLARIEDDEQLNELRRDKALVGIPVSAALRINEGLPVNRRYCRPWTAQFLSDLSRAHAARFRRSLQVNSAVRTVEYQRSLMRVNGNAAPAEGDIASPHLTGATIDIAKKGLSMSEVAWMRAYLLPLEQAGKIDVEEEFYQSCFHITVYKSYAPAEPAIPRPSVSSTLLAERVR